MKSSHSEHQTLNQHHHSAEESNPINRHHMLGIGLLFKALSDQTRIRILFVLKQKERCVHDISHDLNMTQSAISHQLKTLRDYDLVRTRREGKVIYYRLADDHIHLIINQAFDHIRED